jgi:hypothetical protein
MRWQALPGYPGSPFHAVHGLHLPALLPRCAPPTPNAAIGSGILGIVAERDIDSELPLPKYKMLKAHLANSRSGTHLHDGLFDTSWQLVFSPLRSTVSCRPSCASCGGLLGNAARSGGAVGSRIVGHQI